MHIFGILYSYISCLFYYLKKSDLIGIRLEYLQNNWNCFSGLLTIKQSSFENDNGNRYRQDDIIVI